ncbi:hypothetical protein [Sandaracinus amylolyticus]|uniref:Uncharacterized protein n=1 Tax=Sandaracinus amylolyticus TaxID=927083 RepID=A0A0F6YHU4_9BACT|nr:hypothetical protein [Sandaracinus amylolyticus]AKF06022.1 hypothetical protein DB32_003171 [Sandaracinus amylolyticus]
MWAHFIYRVHAASVGGVGRAIARNAELIARPNSGHSYGHVVEHVCRYEGARRVVMLDRDPHRAAYWHSLASEEDVLRLVHERRGNTLFGRGTATDTPYAALMTELRARYRAVGTREEERALLREAEARAEPLVVSEETRTTWRVLLARWKWTKRHTSATSFPFLRAGIDVYKADGFELGTPGAGTAFYAFALFHY